MKNLFAALLFALALGCANLHQSLPSPDLTGLNLDEAAVACLDWAWMRSHTREVAGGVIMDELKLVCSKLTLGTRNSVIYDIDADWMVHFHTHTGRGRMSQTDRELVENLDPMSRPSYVRESSGVVWIYECLGTREDYECDERIVR